MTLITHKN